MAGDNEYWAENYWNSNYWNPYFWAKYVEPVEPSGLEIIIGGVGLSKEVRGGVNIVKEVRGRSSLR